MLNKDVCVRCAERHLKDHHSPHCDKHVERFSQFWEGAEIFCCCGLLEKHMENPEKSIWYKCDGPPEECGYTLEHTVNKDDVE
jgi:hypothetical protein